MKTHTEFELLIRVMEIAREAPTSLADTALEYALSFALNPERKAGQGAAVTAAEVDRLRRIIWASAGANGAVSRREAAALFALNDASRGQPNDPAWRDLFVKAIGASLLTALAYSSPSRQEARHAEAWLEAPTEGVPSILKRTLAELGAGSLPAIGTDELADLYEARNHDNASATEVAEALTGDEADWLIARIGKDGRLDDNEAALLLFVAQEASSVDPRLEPLVAAARARVPAPAEPAPPKPAAPTFGRRAG